LPKPLHPNHYGDAVAVKASRLSGDGWIAGPLADELAIKPIAVFFDELSVAERAGAGVRVPFNGRYATLWMLGSGGSITVKLDGRSVTFNLPADDAPHAEALLNEDTNRNHVLEIEAATQPAVIAGLDVLGQV
ncbi:MAG: hypothetical protein JO349_09080, partial [Candidatus Eremiobacteraeota bacterium]|nr:hypothetical protein [Candidatus Eremiobacteraeota bacterium]